MNRPSLTAIVLFVLAISSALISFGCGGSGATASEGGVGGATLNIVWPNATRLIPVAAKSITVSFLNGSTVAGKQTVSRPTGATFSVVRFNALPAQELTLKAEAFPNANGTGTAQASASKGVTIVANTTTPVSITMASTIESFSVNPGASTLNVGETVNLMTSAVDRSGAAVLTAASAMSFQSSNTAVASVSSTGLVTAVGSGSATITVRETESGMSATAAINVRFTLPADLVNAYLNTLSPAQRAATLVSSSKVNAARWSDLPAKPGADGTHPLRNGVAYSSLNAQQKQAFKDLYRILGVDFDPAPLFMLAYSIDAENVLSSISSLYNGDYIYVGVVGAPSNSGHWLLQFGGHHLAFNYSYIGNTLQSATPFFAGIEPTTTNSGDINDSTMENIRAQGAEFLQSYLDSSQRSAAKLSNSFTDVLLGAGKDARSGFPSGGSGRGLLCAGLNAEDKSKLSALIATFVRNGCREQSANQYISLYDSELDQTFVAYSGNPGLDQEGDYIRIDGPHVWIEFIARKGETLTDQIHYHLVWRDRISDYNDEFGF